MLSDATIDAANRAIMQVFETTSMAWRTIPHWNTGDPGRGYISSDSWYSFEHVPGEGNPLGEGPFGGGPIKIEEKCDLLNVTLAQASSANSDQVVSAATAIAVEVVKQFDQDVAAKLAAPAMDAPGTPYQVVVPRAAFGLKAAKDPKVPSVELLSARSTIESAGYRGSRSVWADAEYFDAFHQVYRTSLILPPCAALLQMSSIYRAPVPKTTTGDSTMIIIGRRQEIAPYRAFEAAAAPEPIDLAVSVPPSLEIIGDDRTGRINLAVRIRYALRFKDNRAVVMWTAPAEEPAPDPPDA